VLLAPVQSLHHFFVYKAEHEENTESKMKVLTEEERVQQIASMLSGSNPGTAALANASELLKSY
jgi:DNA repair protein RecN (Recombination protein N)